MYMIYEAAQRADLLIVAVNSDDSVKSLQKPPKPDHPSWSTVWRCYLLYSFIDYLTWFDENDPRLIIRKN